MSNFLNFQERENMSNRKKGKKKKKKEWSKKAVDIRDVISKMDKICDELLPSMTRRSNTDDGAKESEIDPKTLDQLTEEAVAMKKHFNKPNINSKVSKFFLDSLDYVIRMVAQFQKHTKLPRLPSPFDRITGKYPQWVHDLPIERRFFQQGNKSKLFDSYGDAEVNSVTGSKTDNAYAYFPPSLNEKEKKILLEFNELNEGNPKFEGSIELDHPIVSVTGDFAIAAFNKACEMHVKKDEHNNLHDIEFMECNYLETSNIYLFNMIIEAIEEGNLGVYQTQVVCTRNGIVRALTKFVLTDRKPVGTKAMAVSHFSFLRSVCKTLYDVSKEKLSKLDKILASIKEVRDRGIPWYSIRCIIFLRNEIIEGLHQFLVLGHRFLFSPDCIRTTNPDVWSRPGSCYDSGMVLRTKGTPCRGYDFYKPFSMPSGLYIPSGFGRRRPMLFVSPLVRVAEAAYIFLHSDVLFLT